MIKKLRHKFILILMSVVSVILLGMFLAIFIFTWQNNKRMGDNILQQALEDEFNIAPNIMEFDNKKRPPNQRVPLLILEVDLDNNINILVNQLNFINQSTIDKVIQLVVESNKNSGVLKNFDLRWLKSNDKTKIAFVDVSVEVEILNNLIINLLLIGVVTICIFFALSIFLSHWAIKPVELAWDRQKQFMADASHELKTPLTVILSNVDMLYDQTLDSKNKRRIEHIKYESTMMKKLIEDMLLMLKSDTYSAQQVKENVDFSHVVKNIVLSFEATAFDQNMKLTFEIDENIYVIGDQVHLQQLVAILLDNALKYCIKSGSIKVSLLKSDSKNAILTVYNDGEPIPEDEFSKIFLRFYRLDKSRSDHGQFGLGLSIAEAIVKEHSGKIKVKNHKDGNSFIISIPITFV